MNFLVDANFAYAKDLFSSLGALEFYASRQPDAESHTKESLAKAEVLLVRSTTKVNSELLDQAPNLKFVGSATIGMDHINVNELKQRNIAFAHAPGCNANAVKEYLLASLSLWLEKKALAPTQLSMAVIGYGNVGSKVAKAAAQLGMRVKVVDPFKTVTDEQGIVQVSFEQALDSDIISLHVPLTNEGEHPTYHLMNQTNLGQFSGRLIINTCRGSVINQDALMAHLDTSDLDCILDVWEHEPDINLELLDKVWLATPHIAGYSLEGKAQGSLQVFEALMHYLAKPSDVQLNALLPEVTPLAADTHDWQQALRAVYNPFKDDANIRAHTGNMPECFDGLRKNYQLRRELKSYLTAQHQAEDIWLKSLQV